MVELHGSAHRRDLTTPVSDEMVLAQSSVAPSVSDDFCVHLMQEHALYNSFFPPSPAPSRANSPLRLAPIAAGYFPVGIEADQFILADPSQPATLQVLSPSELHARVESSSPSYSSSASSSSSSPLQTVVSRPIVAPHRTKTKNSNKAREERYRELQYLRRKVVEMEEELERIKHKKPRNAFRAASWSTSSSGEMVLRRKPGVWEEIAARQLEERRRSETENEQLKEVLETQIKIAKSLEKILNKRSTLRGMEACGLGKRKRVFANAADVTDSAMFQELLLRVEGCYLDIERMFDNLGIGSLEESFRDARMLDGPQGMYMEIYANNVLPFTVHAAGRAAWHFFAKNEDHIPFRQYYERKRENMNVAEDTVVENIGLELQVKNSRALFRLKQVMRRYVEADRVVIVWSSIIDPVEFADKPFSGYYFRENGYMLLTKPKTHDPNEYCVLKTCYVITPDFTCNSTLEDDDEIIGELSEFVLNGTAASVAASHQVIENMLLSETLRSSTGRA